MNKMIYNLIFKNETDTAKLSYRLFDTPATRKFIEVTEQSLKSSSKPQLQSCPRYSAADVPKLYDEINFLCEQIRSLDSTFPANCLDLNELHLVFHRFEESLVSNHPLHPLFSKLNLSIHRLEDAVKIGSHNKTQDSYFISHLDPGHSIPMEISDYDEVTYRREAGDLGLAYHTVGKSLYDAFRTRDHKLIVQQMIRPKTNITTQVYGMFKSLTAEMESLFHVNFRAWCEKYRSKSFGYDPDHYLHRPGHIRLGQLIEKISEEQIDDLLKNYPTLARIELL